MRFSASITSLFLISGLSACQGDVDVKSDDEIMQNIIDDVMESKEAVQSKNAELLSTNPRLQEISDNHTQSQIEDCAFAADISNEVRRAQGEYSPARAKRAADRVFEVVYKLEVGEDVSYQNIMEQSGLSGVFDEAMMLTGAGLTNEIAEKLVICVPVHKTIYDVAIQVFPIGLGESE